MNVLRGAAYPPTQRNENRCQGMDGTMLDRWLAESMHDQPYQAVGALPVLGAAADAAKPNGKSDITMENNARAEGNATARESI